MSSTTYIITLEKTAQRSSQGHPLYVGAHGDPNDIVHQVHQVNSGDEA